MIILIIAIVLMILFSIFIANIKQNTVEGDAKSKEKGREISNDNYLPYKSKYILTKTEYTFYKILKPIIEKRGYIICPKVGLKDMVIVTERNNYKKWFAKISQKHIDFLICDSELKPLFAIELDDKSHEKEKAQKNDNFKNNLFTHIGLPLKRIKVNNYTDLENNLFPSEEIQYQST